MERLPEEYLHVTDGLYANRSRDQVKVVAVTGGAQYSLALLALVLFIFTIPWEASLVLPRIGTASRLVGLAAFGLGLWSIIRRSGVTVRPLPLYLFAMTFWVLSLSLTMLWTLDVSAARAHVLTLFQLVAMCWLVWQLCRSDRHRSLLQQAYVLGCLVSVTNTFLQFVAGVTIEGTTDARFVAAGFNANYLAFTLALAIPMAWHLFRTALRPFYMWLNLLSIPALLFGIMLTGSRGGAISAGIGLVLLPLTYSTLRPTAKAVVAASAVLVVALVYAFAPEFEQRMASGLERFTEIPSQVTTGDFSDRGKIWLAGLEAARVRPVLGWGAGSFRTAVEPFLGASLTAHNAFLNTLVEAGVVGLLLFLTALVLVIAPIIAVRMPEGTLYHVLLAVVIVSLMPSTLENGKQIWFVLSLVASRRAYVFSYGVHPAST